MIKAALLKDFTRRSKFNLLRVFLKMAGRNLGAIVGALIGGAVGYLAAKKYETALTVTIGAGAYAVPIAAGALALGYIGKRLCKSK